MEYPDFVELQEGYTKIIKQIGKDLLNSKLVDLAIDYYEYYLDIMKNSCDA